MTEYYGKSKRGRNISWKNVVKFHKEIAARAESGFFSMNGHDPQSNRWSSVLNFQPNNIAGPWVLDNSSLVSTQFKHAVEQESHEMVFLGGPCYIGIERSSNGEWIQNWRPVLYREVKVTIEDGNIEILPEQGHWYLSPLISNLIDRLQLSTEVEIDQLVDQIIEEASVRNTEGRNIGNAIIDSLVGRIQELRKELQSNNNNMKFQIRPSSWILFAPTSEFSAINKNLMSDYDRLEKILELDSENIGGLEVFNESTEDIEALAVPILPVTKLNEVQENAVKQIIGERPLTVISGPPGCGKSQVVLSVLLNAWARGKSVLFVSNNNNAVDVVRDRLERFESEFPIAVRAGNRQKNNILELLRKVLNNANSQSTKFPTKQELENKRNKLLSDRESLQQLLDSKLPQQVTEGFSSALNAYAEYNKNLALLNNLHVSLAVVVA